MARNKQPEAGEESPASVEARQPSPKVEPGAKATPGLVLARNFGIVFRGQSHFWAAGTHFNPATHGELISRLSAAGAVFK